MILALAAAPGAAARTGCAAGYAYAGVQTEAAVRGISAVVTAVDTVTVEAGHIAGWVGVGGVDAGPGGTDAWLQVGLNSLPGIPGSTLYYEFKQPNGAPVYRELETEVPAGAGRRVAVLEMRGRPGWWRVWVNGRAASDPVYLPLRRDARFATITAESRNPGATCNTLGFRFAAVSFTATPGGKWRPVGESLSFQDRGYRLVRAARTGFLALSS